MIEKMRWDEGVLLLVVALIFLPTVLSKCIVSFTSTITEIIDNWHPRFQASYFLKRLSQSQN